MSKLTLPSGATIEGTPEEIAVILEKTDTLAHLEGFYLSESKGYVSISEMHPIHLRNAVVKKYRAWVNELSLDPAVCIDSIRDGIDDKEFIELCVELGRRKARGEL